MPGEQDVCVEVKERGPGERGHAVTDEKGERCIGIDVICFPDLKRVLK